MKLKTAFLIGFIKAAADVTAAPVPPQAATNATELIKHFEGFKPRAYKLPTETTPTVGYGTHLTPEKSGIFRKLFGANLDFNSVSKGTQPVSKDQGSALLGNHLTSISNRLQKLMPSLPNYNPELQGALLNGAYRGDVFQSPKAVNLMNQNRWQEASKEYLNNNEFKTTPLTGVKSRMQYNADVIARQK